MILGLTNPDFLLLDEDPDTPGMDPEKLAAMPIPVYPATAKLTSWSIQKVIATLLDTVDWMSRRTRCRRRSRPGVPAGRAYRLIHARRPLRTGSAPGPVPLPGSPGTPVGLARRRAQLAAEEATARRPAAAGLLAAFDRQLPFTLTAGQAAVGKTLAAELRRTRR